MLEAFIEEDFKLRQREVGAEDVSELIFINTSEVDFVVEVVSSFDDIDNLQR